MSGTFERHIRLQGAFNVRDLGGYARAGGGTTRWRSVLRADGLQGLTPADVATLLDLGLVTVIDLRSHVELARDPSAFAKHAHVDYRHIPLFDSLAPVDQLLASSASFGLAERYASAADLCGPALGRVATTVAEAGDGVVLFNCTAGKDRTGIVAAMLLSLAGVADDEIVADYALTATVGAVLMDRLRQAAKARGLSETAAATLLGSEPDTMRAFLRHVAGRHGGFAAYLAGTGLSPDMLDRLVRRLG
ncbi:tyrosine-protein phosphatase [Aquibium carbonis]|uniref:Tyrosine-protein phosphatase n=1 Tax=Aquibium carbonis TaxID=2495581 RepID=A0A3S0A865_9HYPH|nr:tyrosine-protein phosphatase [Aquibium carbonis]RST86865.1 tyrosine-protein phosphatase [Aquibium carbonis]